MSLKQKLILALCLVGAMSFARPPLESYKRYMIVLVHGVGANTMVPYDYQLSFGDEYEIAPRKSSVFDLTADDNRGLKSEALDSNWQGDIVGTLQRRGFLGHVAWYDFYEPWRSPIYISGEHEISLSRYLGDRSMDDNPMGKKAPVYEFEANNETVKNPNEALANCVKDVSAHSCVRNIKKNKVKDDYFGQTPASYWLHHFFPNDLKSEEKVEYKGFKGPFLNLAQKDWELWYKLRNSTTTVDESEKPRKYILVAHSMGGLTTRDYITGSFYKGDVDKLITLDSPHEGSEIANYVQYWHENSYDGTLLKDLWDNAFRAWDIALHIHEAASVCIYPTSDDPSVWTKAATIVTVLSLPATLAEISNAVGNELSGYHANAFLLGDEYVKEGIQIMTLDDSGFEMPPNEDLKTFNNRSSLNDEYDNKYQNPYFDLVYTSGVPTPGGEGQHRLISKPYANIMVLMGGIVSALNGFSLSSEFMLKFAHRVLAAIALQSLWNDDGSGFVPGWSAKGDNVRIFSNSDVNRYKVSFDYKKSTLDEFSLTLVEIIVGIVAVKKTMKLIGQMYPWVDCAMSILTLFGVPKLLLSSLSSGSTNYNSSIGQMIKDVYDYAGFHGAMVRRVDSDKASDAPSGRGSNKKMIDQLLWEKPSVSIVYNPVNVWDYSKGGYVGLGTTKELFEYKESKEFQSLDVKWKGESSAHEFNINLNTISADDESELKRAGTIYIAGKYAGSKLKSITLKKKKEKESDPEETKKIKVSECTDVLTGNNAGNEWTVSIDNEGLLKCETGWDNSVSATYTMQVEVAHDGDKGGFLIDFGREPGRAFASEELLTAKDSDWDKYITLKNRRPQKKKKVEGRNPTEDELDRTVADMVDYHRSPLLVVNKLPRVFELEVDDLQPDRMNKLSVDFNFGTASITYEAKKDPNLYSNVPTGFKDKPAGFVDPSVEKYTLTLTLGGTTKSAVIDNPIDAWGKMVISLDELEDQFQMEFQPFLEGRNHLRIYSENRWQMSRVQDMNIFIPGPPPTVTPIYPMADDAFCSDEKLGTEFKFETDLIYGQSSELKEDDLNVSYSKNGNITKIKGFKIDHVTGSNTKYTVTSKKNVVWPKGEFAIIIEVKPRINGSPANPITYQFAVKSDCVKPTVAFDDGQEVYNPSLAKFIVFDQDAEDGEHLSVEDLLVELLPAKASETDEKSCDDSDDEAKWHLLSADNFAAPGAKVRNLTWKDDKGNALYPDGKYRLAVFAHDNTINGNESDKMKKDFWKTYDKNGLPKMDENDFPKSRNPCNNVKAMTQWTKAEKNIVLDFTPPVIEAPSFSVVANKDGKIVYAGDALKKDLSISVTATDALAEEKYPLKAVLTMTPSDNLGKFDSKDAINRFDLLPTLKKAGVFELNSTIISAIDPTVSSMVNTMQPIPDGIYALELTVMDQAGNSTTEWIVKNDAGNATTKNYSLLVIDATAPVIKNVNPHSNAESGKKHTFSFEVSEENDIGMLIDLDKVKTSVTGTCGDVALKYKLVNGSGKKKNGYIEYEYETETVIPQDVSGACKTLIVAEDAYGNKGENELAITVDFIPPEITRPSNGDEVSGIVAVYGHAEDPFLPSGEGFQMYELSYKSLDKENDVWKSIGMSVPESQRCANFEYRSCKPVLGYSANSVLGYWNTNMIPKDERDHAYRIRVVTHDKENSREAYVDVNIASEQKKSPTIAFDNLPSEMNFETTNSYNIDWTTDLLLGQNAGLVRLEIMRLNDKGEKTVSVVNRTFENIVPNDFYGEPQGYLGRGAYLWISDKDRNNDKNRYHLKLVAGDKETFFNISLYTRNSASLNILEGSNTSSDAAVKQDIGTSMGTVGTISKTLPANKTVEYVIETESKQGLFWSLYNSTLKYEGGKYEGLDNIPFYVKGRSTDEYAFVGSGKVAIGSKLQDEMVHIPSMIGGRNFVWDGLIDQTAASVPSGNYRFKVTLEGFNDNQSASDEKIVKIVGKSVSLTNVKAVPDKIKFSNVTPKISLHFNIDQDALVSVYVRSKNGSTPTDLNEFMKLSLDGQDLLLDKLLLAGRQSDYVVNWDGSFGKESRQIFPNGPTNDRDCNNNENCGYEFVVEIYDLEGTLKKTSTASFKVVAEDMEEDNQITISVDGNYSKEIEHGGLNYLIANGMNDAVLEFAPAGTRVVTDVVPVQFGYKGQQSIRSYPYERYSVGVQIHKKSIEYWAVVAVKFKYTHEANANAWIFTNCHEESRTAARAYVKTVKFSESDGNKPKTLEFNFHNDRGSDLGGYNSMEYANVELLLIPKSAVAYNTFYEPMMKIDGGQTWDELDQNEWNIIKKYATATFRWGSSENVFQTKNDDIGKDYESLKCSGRQSRESWVTENNKTPPYYNSTQIAWDRSCDVGKNAVPSVCAAKEVEDRSDDPTRANGVYDKGEPILYKGEKFDPNRHKPEFEVVAWAWKNTSEENTAYSKGVCLGCDDCRGDLMFIFDINPTERFWSNPQNVDKNGKVWVDYGWNNDVNRYLTLDPMNENFLFGANGAFKDEIKAPYANPYSNPIVYNLSNRQEESWTEQTLMNLLNNKTFQGYYLFGASVMFFHGGLASDVEMILHNFKIDPSYRKYYPAKFNIDVSKGNTKESVAFDDNSTYSQPINLGGLRSGTSLTVSIGMDKSSVLKPGFDKKALDWPSTQSNVAFENGLSCQPKKGVCGASQDDVLFDMSGVKIEKDVDVRDGFKVYEIPITLGRMPDGSSGFDLNNYLKYFMSTSLTTSESKRNYYSKQGPNKTYDLLEGYSKEDDITLTDARIFDLDPNGDYYVENGTNILRKKGCENGCVYVAAKDPLMSKIDDDGDGRIAEDGKDNIDKDGDLAIDEDPSDAVRVKLENLTFPFTGGKNQRSYKDYALYELLSEKADDQNVDPGNSEESGWSVLLKGKNGSWLNNANLLTTWDVSNDPKSFERTGLFYKDGKKHTDIEIISARGMDNESDAKAASVRITPAKFDGRDRRLLEVKAEMNWKTDDKYEIYASSDKGWIDLTPSPLGKLTNKKLGTIAYWDVETSGFHQLLLIRNAGGKKYYKVFPVAVGAITSEDNKVFADALGRSQISTASKVDFVDVVPLGKGEIPQTIPADAGLGPVVQIYPALTELKSATFNLRFSRDEVQDQKWENDASIYVVSEGFSPQPLQGIQWHFYRIGNDGDEEVVGAKLTSGNWDYAIATGILSITENTNNEKSVQATLGEEVIMDSDGSSVSVTEKEAGVYEVDFNVTSAIGE